MSVAEREFSNGFDVTMLTHHRVMRWVERGTLFLLIVYLFAHTMPRAWSKLNTDFPNYYLSARLVHDRFDTSRMYEWVWLQREKDHRAIDDRIIGLIPITPVSTLAIWPLAGMQPLMAKRIWLMANLVLLIPLAWMLRAVTGLEYRRIALVLALSFPLHRNLLYGQFYILLLLLIVAACWSYLRKWYVLAGALVAIAAACKIFPVVFLVFFLQRRAWRALASGAVTLLCTAAASIAVFGWNVHRTYLHEILPWTLHGEALPPYATLSASISSVLHYLFLAEPQWNPHPWHNSPLIYSLLLPAVQVVVFAPAVLLICRQIHSCNRILLEWSALLVAALAVSTIPASYNFVLLAFPVCVLTAMLLQRRHYGWLAALFVVYFGIGFPMPPAPAAIGPAVLLYVPRLPLLFVLLFGIYLLLWRDRPASAPLWGWTQSVWAVAMVAALVLNVSSTLQRETGMRREYAYRLQGLKQSFLDGNPQMAGTQVQYIAFTQSGYRMAGQGEGRDVDPLSNDELSFAVAPTQTWVESAASPRSRIVSAEDPTGVVVDDGREPMLSADGRSLAFVRDDHGRGRLMVRREFQSDAATEAALTSPAMNVYEASFLSEKQYAFSAVQGGRAPQIYVTDAMHKNAPLRLGESRYPALSPDGRWMAYSRMEQGVWNLWIRNQKTGSTRRIADVPCNQIQSAWEPDSRTLLYGTDCGRSLWFTAVARRRVIP